MGGPYASQWEPPIYSWRCIRKSLQCSMKREFVAWAYHSEVGSWFRKAFCLWLSYNLIQRYGVPCGGYADLPGMRGTHRRRGSWDLGPSHVHSRVLSLVLILQMQLGQIEERLPRPLSSVSHLGKPLLGIIYLKNVHNLSHETYFLNSKVEAFQSHKYIHSFTPSFLYSFNKTCYVPTTGLDAYIFMNNLIKCFSPFEN